MGNSIRQPVQSGNKFASDLESLSTAVTDESAQMAQFSQNLSAEVTQQAGEIRHFSNTLKNVLESANSHHKVSENTLNVTNKLYEMIEESNIAMAKIRFAMQSIDDSAQDAFQIIKIIEDIAFQTKILALNASVEAVRIGPLGKGFAVVANEVNNLAARSAQAAEETEAIIAQSQMRVRDGNSIVESANSTIEQMKDYLGESFALYHEMTDCPVRSGKTVLEVRQGINALTRVVESNLDLAEKTAAGQELSARTVFMNTLLLSQFRAASSTTHAKQHVKEGREMVVCASNQ